MTTAGSSETLAPWKQRFRAPMIGDARTAQAAPERGIAITDKQDGLFQVYAWDVPTGDLRRLTDHDTAVYEAWIDALGRHVYFLQDQGGNELGHLVRVPFEGGPVEDLTPDVAPYTLRGVGSSYSGNMMLLNPVNGEGFQLYCVPLGPQGELGAARRIYQNSYESWLAELSYDGSIAAVISTERAGGQRRYSTLALDTSDGALIGELWDGPEASVEVVMFAPVAGDERILATTSRSGFLRPLIWNPRTNERLDLEFPALGGEIAPLDWSADGKRLLLCQVDRAVQQLYTYDLGTGTLMRLDHPDGTYYVPMPGPGGPFFGAPDEIIAVWTDSAHAPQVITLDAETGAQTRTLLKIDDAPVGTPWRSVTFRSSDGQEVQAWLGLPDGPGPFPTILDTHGGPHFVTTNSFSPFAQVWIDNGFAFFSVNYRGSTTFGRAFKEQIWGDIGHLEVEDMVAGRAWLVEQGIARPDAIVLHGGSYGGFLTLLALGKRPELWAGGVAVAAIGDCAVNYEDASDALKAADVAWFGGTPAEKPALYRAASPITYVEQMAAPVLVYQGRNDTRTTARQMELYEQAMLAHGKPIELLWYDAGHGGWAIDEVLAFYERALEFVREIVDGLPAARA